MVVSVAGEKESNQAPAGVRNEREVQWPVRENGRREATQWVRNHWHRREKECVVRTCLEPWQGQEV